MTTNEQRSDCVPSVVTTLAPGDGAIPERADGAGPRNWDLGETLMWAGFGLLASMGWAAFWLAVIEWWFPKG